MEQSFLLSESQRKFRIPVCRQRKKIWLISGIVSLISLLGLLVSWVNPQINSPLKPGLDFTGGTQLQLERQCNQNCQELSIDKISEHITSLTLPSSNARNSSVLSQPKVQLLDGGQSVIIKLPFLTASQSKFIINEINAIAGPFKLDGQSIEAIGPSLGKQLLYSSFVSLCAAFIGIAVYISFRYDRRFAFLALFAVAHDVIIICGCFAWLGVVYGVEVNSLFAVALLTIAGYSVNDTVVVFDRIRERTREDSSLSLNDQIDKAVSSTLRRTLYTSGTTLLPLLSLMLFGGATLFWFSLALAVGVIVGSWSSIALAPSLLSLSKSK
tara:strand:- start:1717 stop:2694 length:978 start_codon:yes stop_codon:yes gene_type:complete